LNQRALFDLSKALLKFHKSLLDYQKDQVEKTTGKKLNPYEMLGAALNDPEFQWIKPVSQMIVEIDLASEKEQNDPTVALEIENSPPFNPEKIQNFWRNPPEDFNEKVIAAIEHDPDISFLFSEVRLKASALK